MVHENYPDVAYVPFFIIILLASCPNPFEESTLSLLEDLNPPVIQVTAPLSGEIFQSSVTVTGTAVDMDGKGELRIPGDDIYLPTLSWDILDADPSFTPLTIETDGTFTFTFDTSAFDTSIKIIINAVDANGNSSRETIDLLPDTEGPWLELTSPEDFSIYSMEVTLSGRVANAAEDSSISEVASTVSYNLPGTIIAGELAVDPADGTFSAVIDTSAITGTLRVDVTAEDLNGNTTTLTRILEVDGEGPEVTISSPEDESYYGTVVQLSGTVSGDEISGTVSYRIPGTTISGTATIIPGDGTFSAVIDVSSLSGAKTLEVIASDLKGNQTIKTISMIKPEGGGDISGFTVTPGNKEVTLNWDPVTGAESYTLEELSYGDVRLIGTGTSFLWTGLENGEEYLFKITAHLPDAVGEDAESSVISVLPLSERTLMPWVSDSSYGETTMSWINYPMIDRYTVQRTTTPSGPWSTVRTTLSNYYTDSSVSPGQSYYYRVAPASSDFIQSSPVSAASVSFPSGSATLVMPGDVLATEVEGDYLYSLCAHKPDSYIEGILVVTDISSPSNPQIVNQIDLGRTPFDLCLTGDMLWIAMGFNGIQGYSILFPQSPFLVTDLDTNSATSDVGLALCASGSYVYLADGSEGVKIIDVSTPSSPQVKASWTTDIEVATDIALSGDFLYVGVNNDSQWGSFTRIDVSDPLNPSGNFFPLGWECFDTEQFPEPRIDAEGGTVYLATWAQYGVFINNGTVPAYSSPPLGIEITNVEAIGTDLYLMPAGTDGMYADATNPFNVPIASHSFFNTVLMPSDVDISGTLYIASTHNSTPATYSGSIIISDFNTPAGASVIATLETADDFPYAVDAAGDDLYVLFSDGVINTKLGRYDGGTSSPGTGDFSETFDVTGMGGAEPRQFDLVVSGGYAFAADGKNRLTAVNLSDPGSLGAPKHTQTPHSIFALEIAGPYAYCAGRGLSVLDISDPENAEVVFIDSFDSGDIAGASIYDMDRIGNTLYLSGEGKVYSVDISDPVNPGTITLVDDFSMANSGTVVLHEDGFYLVLDDGSSNYRLDVWHPDTGGTFETVNGITDPTAMAASGDYALVGTKAGILAVADISAFDADPHVTTITAGDGRFVTDAVIAGAYAYASGFDDVLDTDGAVWIIDLDG